MYLNKNKYCQRQQTRFWKSVWGLGTCGLTETSLCSIAIIAYFNCKNSQSRSEIANSCWDEEGCPFVRSSSTVLDHWAHSIRRTLLLVPANSSFFCRVGLGDLSSAWQTFYGNFAFKSGIPIVTVVIQIPKESLVAEHACKCGFGFPWWPS